MIAAQINLFYRSNLWCDKKSVSSVTFRSRCFDKKTFGIQRVWLRQRAVTVKMHFIIKNEQKRNLAWIMKTLRCSGCMLSHRDPSRRWSDRVCGGQTGNQQNRSKPLITKMCRFQSPPNETPEKRRLKTKRAERKEDGKKCIIQGDD